MFPHVVVAGRSQIVRTVVRLSALERHRSVLAERTLGSGQASNDVNHSRGATVDDGGLGARQRGDGVYRAGGLLGLLSRSAGAIFAGGISIRGAHGGDMGHITGGGAARDGTVTGRHRHRVQCIVHRHVHVDPGRQLGEGDRGQLRKGSFPLAHHAAFFASIQHGEERRQLGHSLVTRVASADNQAQGIYGLLRNGKVHGGVDRGIRHIATVVSFTSVISNVSWGVYAERQIS
mmetsp:Transcript_56203/g.98624  ORF Transcript_56203/g.98624 Transcript_56203/m.98624 type:complete len:233 (-) Transcript_56203:250-948(-)